MRWWRNRVQYIDNDLVLDKYVQPVTFSTGRTQLIPLESYRYREHWWSRFSCFNAIVYALAMYGLYTLLNPVFYYAVTPYLSRLWNWVTT